MNTGENMEPGTAMKLAMKQSFSTVAASAAMAIGFAALIFMRFGIGADLGLNLLQGIVFSFIAVMVFMPVLTLMLYKAIDKTKHRRLVPDMKNAGNLLWDKDTLADSCPAGGGSLLPGPVKYRIYLRAGQCYGHITGRRRFAAY